MDHWRERARERDGEGKITHVNKSSEAISAHVTNSMSQCSNNRAITKWLTGSRRDIG